MVKNSFERFAKEYETLVGNPIFNKFVWGTNPSDYKKFVKHSLEGCSGNILDVGCGGLVQTADEYCKITNPIVLFDYSPKMLDIGRKRILKNIGQIPARIQLVEGSVWSLPFEKNSFDTVFCFGLLHIFDNKAECIDKIFQALKSGGCFCFSSLINDRCLGRLFIRFMQKHKVLGSVLSSIDTIRLFEGFSNDLSFYTKGNLIFISGKKK